MHVRPVDMPELRAETLESVGRVGIATYEMAIRKGRQPMKPIAPTAVKQAEILAREEVRRLGKAELFHVSAEMAELSVIAAKTLPAFTLMPEDIPAAAGFVYFDAPIAVVDYTGMDDEISGRTPIVAASWSPWTGGNRAWINGGIWVTFYGDSRAIVEYGIREGLVGADEVRPHLRTMARLVLDNEIQVPFSADEIPAVLDDDTIAESWQACGGPTYWMTIMKAAWLLMAQPITATSDAHFDRAARRRLAREGIEPSRVRVIALRRANREHGNGESDREYHHQWIVRGHWRQQWYPSRQVNRPVWIAPHVKGPEGAPMLGGEKVYAWSR